MTNVPGYRPDVPAWLELGGVWVTAALRGGAEYGEAWHKAGMLEKKQNVFDDLIAIAEHLVTERYTSPAKLAISGGSNGGLLVAAVMEQRPDLFAVALPAVGVLDMLRYDRFTGGKAWVTEYGSATDPQQFPFIFSIAAAQRQARHVLSRHDDHDRRPRRSCGAEPLVQVHGRAAGRAGLRQARADPRRDRAARTTTAPPTSVSLSSPMSGPLPPSSSASPLPSRVVVRPFRAAHLPWRGFGTAVAEV